MHRSVFNLYGRLCAALNRFRSDQRGSLTLLSGMIVFMGTIFSIIAFDTNMAVYNRITAQNAVDSAAESAALWQARSCNMLQHLNNLHYDVDKALCIAEGVAATACVLSGGLLAAEIVAKAIPFVGPAASEAIHALRMVSCAVCDLLPWIDRAQEIFYDKIMKVQEAIVKISPLLTFGYANASAKGSNADPLLASFSSWLGEIGQNALGITLPGLGDIGQAIGGGLGSVPIFAAPLDPTSLDLYVKRRDNDGSPPLKWPAAIGEFGDKAGYVGCMFNMVVVPTYEDSKNQSGFQEPWGWDDQYFFGHPGYMTWVAGKTNRTELIGLGDLRWLNGDPNKNPDKISRVMWNPNAPGERPKGPQDRPVKIPGFMAIASSQIEGNSVVMHADADAEGKLIKVVLPKKEKQSLDKFFIFH